MGKRRWFGVLIVLAGVVFGQSGSPASYLDAGFDMTIDGLVRGA